MTLKAIARLQEKAATPEQSVAFVQKVFSQTGLSKWVQSVKARPDKSGGIIVCKGATSLGPVAFDLAIATDKRKPTVYFFWADVGGLWQSMAGLEKLDDIGNGITKQDIRVSAKTLEKATKDLGKLQTHLPDLLGFYSALVAAQIKIADGVKASGGMPI